MSRQNPRHPQKPRQPNPNDNGSQKETTNRHVYIEPGAKIDLVQDLRNDIKTAQADGTKQASKQLFWAKVAAFAAIGATFFVGLQGLLLQQSNRINREALQSVQRAFMGFKEIKSNRRPRVAGNHYWKFSAQFENTGNTTANRLKVALNCEILPGGEPNDLMFSELTPAPGILTIGPHEPQLVGEIQREEVELFGDDLGGVIGGVRPSVELTTRLANQPPLFCWGWEVYKDAFLGTKPHVTEFCERMIKVILDDEKGELHPAFGGCAGHNCTDDDCKNYPEIVKTAYTEA